MSATPTPPATECLDPIDQSEGGLAWLYARINYEQTPPTGSLKQTWKLARMGDLCDRLDNPQQGLRCVHIAGTKGKGSTAAMVAAICRASGIRTGLFTSPHLQSLCERFVVDGSACSNKELAELIAAVRPAVEAMDDASPQANASGSPTFFEIVTAIAFLHFRRRQVELAVLEVGMGGRLDSTNVCESIVSAITSISFDHTKQLGKTLDKIAREKAGIIRPGVPIVSGVTEEPARSVIRQIATERNAPLIQLGLDFRYEWEAAAHRDGSFGGGDLQFFPSPPAKAAAETYRLAMPGQHQANNAAVALAICEQLIARDWPLKQGAIRSSLAELRVPARCEVLHEHPLVMVDAAHNVASVAALCETLEEAFPRRKRIFVFASTADKDVRGMLRRLLRAAEKVILTRFTNNPRSLSVDKLASTADAVRQEIAAESPLDVQISPCEPAHSAWQLALQSAESDDLICITGSFFLVAELRPLIHAELEKEQKCSP